MKHSISAAICFFIAPALMWSAALDAHWIDAGNHGVSRWFGPRSAVFCEGGRCRSFTYTSEIQWLNRPGAWQAQLKGKARYTQVAAQLQTAIRRKQMQSQRDKGRRVAWVLAVTGLLFLLLGGLLLALRNSVKWRWRLPTISRYVGCGVALVGVLATWSLTRDLALGFAKEERFINYGWAFFTGQAGLLLGGVAGYLAGRPGTEAAPD